jgi:hypothetical protein
MPSFEHSFPRWLDMNDKKIPTATEQQIKNLKTGASYTFEGFETTHFLHGDKHLLLIPSMCITYHGHTQIYGFFVQGNKIRCRYFWTSLSEGCWRVGTGYDEKEEEDPKTKVKSIQPGRFKKGMMENSGYIFETQVTANLAARLEKIYTAARDADFFGALTNIDSLFDLSKASGHLGKMNKLLVGEKSDLFNEYKNEIKYKPIFKGPLNLSPYAVDPKNPTSESLLKKSATQFQSYGKVAKKVVDDKTKAESYTITPGRTTVQQLQQITKNKSIWDIIYKSLLNPLQSGKYEYNSELLDSIVKVETFSLETSDCVSDKICIEIAYTEKKYTFNFKDKYRNANYTITSPICWVKTVYFPDIYSSFGNYLQFPEDLSFLPEKPVDYDSQISTTMQSRLDMDVKTGTPYKHVALFDEKYSPLVRAFKEARGFPTFKQKYSPPAKGVAKSSIDKEDLFKIIKPYIIQSCIIYLTYDKFHTGHGETGKKRVKAFMELVEKTQLYAGLAQAVYQLFALNTVDGRSFTASHVFGLFETGKISTRGHSYIAFFLDALRKSGLRYLADAKDLVDLDAIRTGKDPGNCILRVLLYMKDQDMFYTFPGEAKLEGALNAIKGVIPEEPEDSGDG